MVLANKGEADIFIQKLWKEKFPPDQVYISTMVEYEDQMEEDGGRMIRYSEDPSIFRAMAEG